MKSEEVNFRPHRHVGEGTEVWRIKRKKRASGGYISHGEVGC
jgi:hypothetical protein